MNHFFTLNMHTYTQTITQLGVLSSYFCHFCPFSCYSTPHLTIMFFLDTILPKRLYIRPCKVRMKTRAFWDIASCSLGREDQCFKGAYCLHHQRDQTDISEICTASIIRISSPWWWRQYAPLKHQSTPTLHAAIYQKALIFTLAAVRTWNLKMYVCLSFTVKISFDNAVYKITTYRKRW
jgi:hypothetical protein